MSELSFQPLIDSNFHHAIARAQGVSVVIFSSTECGTCRRAEQLLPALFDGVVKQLFKVDVQLSPGLTHEFGVFHLPALFVFRDGEYHAPLDCELTRASARATLARALAAPAQEEP